ncbi:hypothetical protein WJX72_012125 [[Myrmecia] bisecta]|uniref:Uncharacterized protein n=1 Tax=[Myrmecia] bisecta TaxID=41462 RepID=A0AAW1NYJ0_9CHLO
METSEKVAMLGLDRNNFGEILVTIFDHIHVNGEPHDRNVRAVGRRLECVRHGKWAPTTMASIVSETCNKFLCDLFPSGATVPDSCQRHIEEAEHLLNLDNDHEVLQELGKCICQTLAAEPQAGAILQEPDSLPSDDAVADFKSEDLTGINDFPGKLDRTRLAKLVEHIWVSNPSNRSIHYDPVADRFSCLAGGLREGLPGCRSVAEDLECLLGQVASHIETIKDAVVAKLQLGNASQAQVDKIKDTAELLSSYVDICINEVRSGQHEPAREVEQAIIAIKKVLSKNGQPVGGGRRCLFRQ